MSALARPNLVDFIQFLLSKTDTTRGMSIMNACDAEPYEFSQITDAFRRSALFPKRPIIRIPIPLIWILTRLAGLMLPKRRKWLHSGHKKLTQDLVFDNSLMLAICPTSLSLSRGGRAGFTPKHTLNSIFAP